MLLKETIHSVINPMNKKEGDRRKYDRKIWSLEDRILFTGRKCTAISLFTVAISSHIFNYNYIFVKE